ncbi:MAG: hypothetical protein COZ47_10645 [Lysobacterales bacterium CG_4_10_14_3_um_filter_64_11]|nr:MAG: hypothetical protein COZ47_10645 [Xanthomonadales bacterium CG_4_10_14_3_um_filter_64_11]
MLFFLLLVASFLLVGAAIFQWLWNITMPETFDLPYLRYWVAFRLLLIAGFLTSGSFVHLKVP